MQRTSRPRIIILPGMGADARLVASQRALDADIEVPQWLEPVPGESLSAYAERFAPTIDRSTPFYLGGVSFGGMVAQELARHLSPAGLILIASCRRGRDLGLLRRGVLSSSYLTPNWAVQCAKHTLPLMRPFFNPVNSEQRTLLGDMLNATTPQFLRWSMQAILTWPGCDISCPLLHIHGTRDRIIPIKGVQPTHAIQNAGHVVNMTHADEVNEVISEWLQQR